LNEIEAIPLGVGLWIKENSPTPFLVVREYEIPGDEEERWDDRQEREPIAAASLGQNHDRNPDYAVNQTRSKIRLTEDEGHRHQNDQDRHGEVADVGHGRTTRRDECRQRQKGG
jgi:hypothetical protein